MKNIVTIVFSVFLIFNIACSKEDTEPTGDSGISEFTGVEVIQYEFNGQNLIIAGSGGYNFISSFENIHHTGELLEFTAIQDSMPIIMKDNYGGRWDIFGLATSGPTKGKSLKPTTSYMAYWFAFGAFYPGVEIYSEGPITVEIENKASDGWLVDKSQVFAGTLVPEAIPSIDNPKHINFKLRDYLRGFYIDDNELILGIYVDNVAIAYPQKVLNWHEIVNDKIGSNFISVSYCPLTGSGMAWNRILNGQETSFGVSGLLYNSNLIPFDRKTKSYWSQMRLDCIHGELISHKFDNYRVIETTWKTWKTIFPETKVLSSNTGFDRDYNESPLIDYENNHDFLAYPVAYDDVRVPRKERVHGIIVEGEALVFRFSDFQKSK